MFNKTVAYGATLITLLLSSILHAQEAPITLTLYTWEDYTDQTLIDEWEAKTGIQVKQVYYDDEARRNLVLSGYASGQIDVAVVDRATINILSGAGHLYPVSKQSNREVFWQEGCGAYGRQYLWGSYGLVYRKDKLSQPPTGWKALFDQADKLSGHIGMLGQADEIIAPALSALGYSINATNEKELQEAFQLLKTQSQHVGSYEYIFTYVSSNPNQDNIWIAPAYSGDQDGLNEMQGGDLWQYVIPDEGAIIWIDCLAITSNSNHKEEAQAFIDFMSSKENSARSSETLWTASPYVDAKSFVDETVLNDPTVYLDSETLEHAMLFEPLRGSDILKRTRIKDALIRYHDSN